MVKNPRYRGYITSSEIGRKLFGIKAARAAHKSILAQGRKLCAEACLAAAANKKARREAKALIAEKGRSGSTMPEGSY
jgi:hypothetical protein